MSQEEAIEQLIELHRERIGMHEERIALLREAMALIDRVRESLDATAAPCDACGHTRYTHWNQAQAYQELAGTLTKLRKVSGKLELEHDREAEPAEPAEGQE